MAKVNSKPEATLEVRVKRRGSDKWKHHQTVRLPAKMAQALAKLVRKEA